MTRMRARFASQVAARTDLGTVRRRHRCGPSRLRVPMHHTHCSLDAAGAVPRAVSRYPVGAFARTAPEAAGCSINDFHQLKSTARTTCSKVCRSMGSSRSVPSGEF